MTESELIELLKEDLINEYHHMHFYLNASCHITGLFRQEIGEFLAEEARDEMKHVEEFTKLIIEISGDTTYVSGNILPEFKPVPILRTVREILAYVLKMEEEVVERYVTRMDQAVELGGVDGRYVEIFLEDQILDSKSTAAHVRQLLAQL